MVHHHGDQTSCGHYTCHVQTRRVDELVSCVAQKKWYMVNDEQVDEITCPYVNGRSFIEVSCIVEDHPWRPIKHLDNFFSVDPSCYIDVSDQEYSNKREGDAIAIDSKMLRGGIRTRRMVSNVNTVQSAYMCL